MGRKWVLLVLLVVSLAVFTIFLREGKQEKPALTPVLNVVNKTARDITETVTAPIEVSTQQEIEIGRQVLSYFSPLPENDPASKRVKEIGKRITPYTRRKDIVYHFYATQQPMVNAFAAPGGFVMVTTGMLCLVENDDELAWVIGHEISHVENRHALVRMRQEMVRKKLSLDSLPAVNELAKLAETLLRLGYSETMELEADRGGVRLVLQADYDARAAIKLIEYMQGKQKNEPESRNPLHMGVRLSKEAIQGYFATHPNWQQRKDAIREEIGKF
jgi:predicted Zn-dependent protease